MLVHKFTTGNALRLIHQHTHIHVINTDTLKHICFCRNYSKRQTFKLKPNTTLQALVENGRYVVD